MNPRQEGDEAQLLYGHHDEVEGAAETARALALSRRQGARAESDLGRIARMERERVRDQMLSTALALHTVRIGYSYNPIL